MTVDFLFTYTHEVSLCSPTSSRSEQLLQSTKIQFTADSKCALTNIGFIQICSKVPLATFSSLRLCFLKTLELSGFSGRKHRGKWISEWHREVFTERDISGSTRKYLRQMCFQMPPARAGNPTMWPVKATQSEFWRLLMSPQSREIRNLVFM